MKKKNILVMTLSLALVAVVAIGATLAYFVSTTNKVENAFSASDGLAIDLNEHNYIQNTNQLGTDKVKANTYKDIYPNKVVPKDPFVSVDTVPTTGADIFVIISGADDDLMSLNIDTANWTKITKEDGVNGIYKYNKSVKATGDLTPVFNKVTFANYSEKPASIPSISLYAYGIQSEGMSGNDTTSALALTALNAKAGTNFTLA
ncbi:hypothetical protein H7271_04455 [Bittarella massiliensis]|uniref:hypothetical protein n=1 Tax=Bittarella massiliensis (ex Durand et al. 2017) TaxID=1720313 RepID=UPI00163CD098|nr:hypothetical protein [Bittarella massiliensis (ex Durand et al. 2017)]MBC2870852.1 hypothetical protein [Bittarella massiliensis (ex Durand et al. 2017)]